MINRSTLAELTASLDSFPVVALLGPRQVGKTTLALMVADSLGVDKVRYLDLESPADRARLADPEAYLGLQSGRLVILDEIHRTPELFPVLRSVVDRRRREGQQSGQFLVLGSASLELLQETSESLAGRIAFVELNPIGVDEIEDDNVAVDRLWLRGGFPDSLLARSDKASLNWRRAFIRTYLERDIPQLGPRVPSETLRRFWTMLAHSQGQLLNAAKLASSLGVSGQSVARYLDLLVDLLLVRRLQPWSGNVGKRLVKSPRTYIRDSGAVHALLNLKSLEDLLGHPVAGPSWEGMAIENLIAASSGASVYFYRTSAGAEVDLVIELPGGELCAVEIKRSSAPSVTRGFWNACEDLDVKDAMVVYSGNEEIPMGQGVTALGLREGVDWVKRKVAG